MSVQIFSAFASIARTLNFDVSIRLNNSGVRTNAVPAGLEMICTEGYGEGHTAWAPLF